MLPVSKFLNPKARSTELPVAGWEGGHIHKAVFLNRGNHEDTQVSTCYGFCRECLARYPGEDGGRIFAACERVFAALPVAHLLGQKGGGQVPSCILVLFWKLLCDLF